MYHILLNRFHALYTITVYADPAKQNSVRALLVNKIGDDKHLLICKEIHQLYAEPESRATYKIYKWLLEFTQRINGNKENKENVAAVVDLMKLPEDDKFEKVSFEYFLKNQEFLFFHNDALWTVIGSCHCFNYANRIKSVC